MSNENLWLKKLSDFFIESDNWETACKTVDAVDVVTAYWQELFWQNVKSIIEKQLGDDISHWACEVVDGNEVCLFPIDYKSREKRTCSIGVHFDEEDGGYFYIWVDTNEHKLGKKTTNYKLIKEISGVESFDFNGEDSFYLSNVVPNLDKSLEDKFKLMRLIKGTKDSSTLAGKVVSFINQTNIHNVLLELKSDV